MDKTVPQGRVKGTLTPPCSKSYAQRALAAALLTEGESCLRNLEYCDDTRAALRCIETLGASVRGADGGTVTIRGGLRPRDSSRHGSSPPLRRFATCPSPSKAKGRF